MTDGRTFYHYTSSDGLLGMLGGPHSRGKLWLTQVQYMNDRAETRHAYRLIAQRLRGLDSRCSKLRQAVTGILGVPYPGEPWGRDDTGPFPRVFVFSLSEERDLLSQWRGYAPGGGYAIGYNEDDLRSFASAHGLTLIQCNYDEKEQSEIIDEKLIEIEENLANGYYSPRYAQHPDAPAVEARVAFQQVADVIAPVLKHPSFQEEREWRLLGTIGIDDKRSRFRTRGNLVVPYVECDISAQGSTPLIPAQIIVGPNVDFGLAQHSVTFLTFHLDQKPSVWQSTSTLRT